MKTAYLIVGGSSDEEILRAVLPPRLLEGIVIVPAGGLANMTSLARSLLVRRSVPVAIFADADSLEEEVIGERRDQFKDLVNAVAGKIPSAVVLAVPEIEAIFFSAPDLIKGVFGQAPAELMALGRRDPKGVLTQLGSISKNSWDLKKAFGLMSPKDLEQLRETQPMRELAGFLEHVQSGAAVA
jgi:hypothetical protein